jgi:hypothetical protein
MRTEQTSFQLIGMLIAVALAATVLALGLQTYLGRLPVIAGLGTLLAAIGGVLIALRATRRSDGGR